MSERFNIVKKGYDPAEVDSYLTMLETELKNYREKNSAINNAIVNAQIAADSIIQNAKNQARIIKEGSVRQLTEISASIGSQRQLLKGFTEEYAAVLNKYMTAASNADMSSVAAKIDAFESFLQGYTGEITDELEVDRTKFITPPTAEPMSTPETVESFNPAE